MSTVGQSSALNAGLPAATCPAGLADPENRLEKRLAEAVSPVPVGVDTDEQPDKMSAAASKAAHLSPRHRGSIFEHRIEFTRSILKTSETLPTALLTAFIPAEPWWPKTHKTDPKPDCCKPPQASVTARGRA
jgi:hypothetical protein